MDLTGGLLNQTVTIEPFASYDMYGDRTYGTAISYKCREEATQRVIKNIEGEDVINTSIVYLAPTYIDSSGNTQQTTVGYYDRITLTNGTKPVILRIDKVPDLDGTNGYVEIDT